MLEKNEGPRINEDSRIIIIKDVIDAKECDVDLLVIARFS